SGPDACSQQVLTGLAAIVVLVHGHDYGGLTRSEERRVGKDGLTRASRKPSNSNDTGRNCVEVAIPWHKSSYSGGNAGACVEVAETPDAVLVRDIQPEEGRRLVFTPCEWVGFLAVLRTGRL